MNDSIYRLSVVAFLIAAVLACLSALALLAAPLPAGLAVFAWIATASLVPLLLAGAVFARQAWQEARWDGVLPLRHGR